MASVERVRCSGRRLRRARLYSAFGEADLLRRTRACMKGQRRADEGVSEGPMLLWTRVPVKQIRCGGP